MRAVLWLMMLALAPLLAAGAALSPSRAPAQEIDGTRMEEIERRLEQRRRAEEEARAVQIHLEAEARALSERLVAAAARLRRQEAAVAAAGARLARLESKRQAVRARLAERRGSIVRTLAALEHVSRQPPALLLARPSMDATATVRSAMLLTRLVPMLEEEAEVLRAEIARLRALAEDIGAERRRLAAEREDLAERQVALDRLLAEKRRQLAGAESVAAAQASARAALAAKAEDLRMLIERLEREAVLPQPKPKIARAALAPPRRPQRPARSAVDPDEGGRREREQPAGRGLRLLVPARGPVVRDFGGTTEIGGRSKGLEIAAAPGSYVLAPVGGRVLFAGPFRGYGQLLIISAGGGYHVLLAGLSSIDAVVGQSVLQGEPVARMPGGGGGAAGVQTRPRLYVELRSDGDPIDPAPWLGAGKHPREGKVSG